MVSLELIRRYPFFAGLSYENIVALAEVADELSVSPGHYFFHGNHSAPIPNQLPSTSSGNDSQTELVEGVEGSERLLFHEADELDSFYLTLEGEVVIVIDLPKQNVEHTLSEMFTRDMQTTDVTVISCRAGRGLWLVGPDSAPRSHIQRQGRHPLPGHRF